MENKLQNKKLDMVIANNINDSMGENSTEIFIIDNNEVVHIPKKDKSELACDILNHIYKLINKKKGVYEYIN